MPVCKPNLAELLLHHHRRSIFSFVLKELLLVFYSNEIYLYLHVCVCVCVSLYFRNY